LAVVWGGPLIGSVVPLLAFSLAAVFRWAGMYLLRFFAGFCLVANGVYIGIGWLLADGADPWVMTENGSPRWLLILFGLLATPLGFYLWHRSGSALWPRIIQRDGKPFRNPGISRSAACDHRRGTALQFEVK
jgi:hypothetical protein